jgi:hypothetical protein
MSKSNFQKYLNYCKSFETTDLYAEFSFYSLIAACLQRRVWCSGGDWGIYPNLYLVFVGEPATGKTNAAKTNINLLRRLVNDRKQQIIPTAPDTITVEALIRKLAFGINIINDPLTGKTYAQSPMTFISEELGNLFKKDDQQLVKFLIQGYDCGNYNKELKGSEKTNQCESISNMCLNFLAATTPINMQEFMSKGLMEDGFLGRAIFLYGGYPKVRIPFFIPTPEQDADLRDVELHCRCLTTLIGQCQFTPEALKFFEEWVRNDDGGQWINEDRKLQFYYGRKKINVIKLAMVIHFAENYKSMDIELDDVQKALAALARAEVNMHLALGSSAKNPSFKVAEVIVSFLEDRKRRFPTKPDKYKKKTSELQLIFNSEADSQTINQALQYMMISKRVITTISGGEIYYEGFGDQSSQ